jgi:D-lactate dehydrogenase (cytochrome)
VCSFATLGGAVDTVVQSIQCAVPLARVEILDTKQMIAVNRWSKLDYPEARRCSSNSTAAPRMSPNRSRR